MSVLNPKPDTTIAYTDGACKGNPGIGGWGAFLIFSDGTTCELYGGEKDTTNNRMELMGAIEALKNSPKDITLEIWTDSNYVKNGITDWIIGWKKRGWRGANKKPIKNQALWQELDALRNNRNVSWHWVKGHSNHAGNDKADTLANLGVEAALSPNSLSPNNLSPNDLSPNDLSPNNLSPNKTVSQPAKETMSSSSSSHINSNITDTSKMKVNMADPITLNEQDDHQAQVDGSHSTPAEDFDGDTSRANPNFRPLLPHPVNKGLSSRQLIMDTETTGLDALKGDRIIEVGIVELVDRKPTGNKLHVYINPERSMDEEVIRIHGITEAFLADKPLFKDIAKSLYEFMIGSEVIAHNAPFDMSFLSMEFDKVGLTGFADHVQVTDSLVMAKQQYPGQRNTLDALVRRLNVGKKDRTFHGALLDAEILAEVYLTMTGGQVALAIDEETTADGHVTHASFAHLADKIIADSNDTKAHFSWLNELIESYPALNKQVNSDH